jgi:hypothetical protein
MVPSLIYAPAVTLTMSAMSIPFALYGTQGAEPVIVWISVHDITLPHGYIATIPILNVCTVGPKDPVTLVLLGISKMGGLLGSIDPVTTCTATV